MKQQNFAEEMEKIDDGVGVGEYIISLLIFFGDNVGLFANFAFKVFDICKMCGEDEVGD